MVLLNVFKKSKIVINEKAVTLLIGFFYCQNDLEFARIKNIYQ